MVRASRSSTAAAAAATLAASEPTSTPTKTTRARRSTAADTATPNDTSTRLKRGNSRLSGVRSVDRENDDDDDECVVNSDTTKSLRAKSSRAVRSQRADAVTKSSETNGILPRQVKTGQSKEQSKRSRRKQRQKTLRQEARLQEQLIAERLSSNDDNENDSENVKNEVDVVYVREELDQSSELVCEFADVFKRFAPVAAEPEVSIVTSQHEDDTMNDDSSDEDEDEEEQISNRKLKKLNRLSVAELKQLVDHPEVVETHDTTSSDPQLLVHLKSYRNTVRTPVHWSQKRKFLQNKRGVDKTPFALPAFIEATGISQIRQAHADADEQKLIKARAREKMQPKMNRIDIDYQVLHDAFFRHQTKPKMTTHGDIYFEGKEFTVQLKRRRPGVLSQRLKEALGLHDGFPPPWLVHMQRFGPPPSYPGLKIPGLNAPLPPGASYGYSDGQWGKPPVDELGMPLYGDPFGVVAEVAPTQIDPVILEPWGEIEEEFEEEEAGDEVLDEDIGAMSDTVSGLDSVASIASSGVDTPDAIELRKGTGMDTPDVDLRKQPRQLYQVLEQQETSVGDALYGSSHTYKVPTASSASRAVASQLTGSAVDLSLAPEELESLDEATLKRKYQEEVEAVKALRQGDDLSDVMLEETRKRKRKEETKKAGSKKYKDYKF